MDLERLAGMPVYPQSVVEAGGSTFFLARDARGRRLGILGAAHGFGGGEQSPGGVTFCPLTAANAAAMRDRMPWLRPQPLGLATSAGCGDRLGLATPGHLRAVRQAGDIAPILAQQSMRENARTGRTPQNVMDDALWGIFQEGWRDAWGADADHLKTIDEIDLCLAAGYTFFTIDPGDHVNNRAHTASLEELKGMIHALPWDLLEDSPEGLHTRYLGRQFRVESFTLEFRETTLARAAAKYGRALAHTVRMYRHLAAQSQSFELEMSVDETEAPTSVEEHFYVATELKRLGVEWVSLAPRYIGRFEKGVDYIGDLVEFETEFAQHAAVARTLGPYKLSIHSGSDKFTIYPIVARHTRGLVHLKTAGTSYLEALRSLAVTEPDLFRSILAYAMERYPDDRATYHVSAELGRVPDSGVLPAGELPGLLDQFDVRQVLHVTFGSALDRFGIELLAVLDRHEEAHYAALIAHFGRHLSPFAENTGGLAHD